MHTDEDFLQIGPLSFPEGSSQLEQEVNEELQDIQMCKKQFFDTELENFLMQLQTLSGDPKKNLVRKKVWQMDFSFSNKTLHM